MKRCLTLFAVAAALSASPAFARDTIASHSIDAALKGGNGSDKVDSDIALYFAGRPHPRVVRTIGEYATNKKTNSFGKSDEKACEHVFLSAVIELQNRARAEGGNAVINIRSNYHGDETSSPTDYVCGAGAVIAGVALKGDVVVLRK